MNKGMSESKIKGETTVDNEQTPFHQNVKRARADISHLIEIFNLRTVMVALSDELIERGDELYTSSFGDKKLARQLSGFGRKIYGLYVKML